MILTGSEIVRLRKIGEITIEPFCESMVNPNSYNYRLGELLKLPNPSEDGFIDFIIPQEGFVLTPHTLYLGHTYEKLGSTTHSMSLIGRSSIGRLGLFLQVSANLGHTGSCHCWTLELVATRPIRIYPKMRIGQISYWENIGLSEPYTGGYSKYDFAQESKMEQKPS